MFNGPFRCVLELFVRFVRAETMGLVMALAFVVFAAFPAFVIFAEFAVLETGFLRLLLLALVLLDNGPGPNSASRFESLLRL